MAFNPHPSPTPRKPLPPHLQFPEQLQAMGVVHEVDRDKHVRMWAEFQSTLERVLSIRCEEQFLKPNLLEQLWGGRGGVIGEKYKLTLVKSDLMNSP